jgi:hypothetical protein
MKPTRLARIGTLFTLVALLLPLSAAAAWAEGEDAATAPDIAEQLEGIRGELKTIARLLGAVEGHQRVGALIARIGLKQQRLASIEGRLRSTRDEQESLEQEIERLTAIEQSWTEGLDEALDDGLSEDERRGLEMMRQEKKSVENRVETLRLRVVELENDLMRAQEDVLALEEIVDERLGLR